MKRIARPVAMPGLWPVGSMKGSWVNCNGEPYHEAKMLLSPFRPLNCMLIYASSSFVVCLTMRQYPRVYAWRQIIWMTGEYTRRMGRDVKWRDFDLNWNTVQEFDWRDWGKLWENKFVWYLANWQGRIANITHNRLSLYKAARNISRMAENTSLTFDFGEVNWSLLVRFSFG
jgi:hypothetical protein